MSLITETSLRAEIKNKRIDKYYMKPGTKITPSARQYLKDRNIELMVEEQNTENTVVGDRIGRNEEKPSAGYIFGDTLCYLDRKPEFMTQLYGKRLVYKNHPRIVFRGTIDSLQSMILLLQAEAAENNQDKLVKELEEILLFVRKIMRCEVLEEEFPAIGLLGMKYEELREMSHNPVKHFNMKHILPNYKMGRTALELNALRSSIREAEIAAVGAFRKEDAMERDDLITALNRLSSCVYIMMLKCINGAYR